MPEHVRCQLKIDIGFLKYFLSNMGVNTLFGLCIDKLEAIANKATKEERVDGPKRMQLIFTLLYVDNVVLFSYIVDDMQSLIEWKRLVVSRSATRRIKVVKSESKCMKRQILKCNFC